MWGWWLVQWLTHSLKHSGYHPPTHTTTHLLAPPTHLFTRLPQVYRLEQLLLHQKRTNTSQNATRARCWSRVSTAGWRQQRCVCGGWERAEHGMRGEDDCEDSCLYHQHCHRLCLHTPQSRTLQPALEPSLCPLLQWPILWISAPPTGWKLWNMGLFLLHKRRSILGLSWRTIVVIHKQCFISKDFLIYIYIHPMHANTYAVGAYYLCTLRVLESLQLYSNSDYVSKYWILLGHV